MSILFASSDNKSLEEILLRIGDAICVSDKNMNFKAANMVFAAFYGLPDPSLLIGKSAFDVYPDFKKSVFYEASSATIETGVPTTRIGFSANLKTWVVIRCYKYDDDNYVLIVHKLIEGLNKVGYVSHYDSLTSLPNRFIFEQDNEAFKQYKQPFVLTLLDIDRFNRINERLGSQTGDMCLMEVAARIKKNIPVNDNLYRIGGDQFLILSVSSKEAALQKINHLNEAFNEPLMLDGQEYVIQMTTALAEVDNEDTHGLQKVELALAFAKKQKIPYAEYREDMQNKQFDPFLTKEIKQAIEKHELQIYLQPQADMLEKKVCGAEVLVRWQHPVKGFMAPYAFLPFAEETGLIYEIDQYIIETSLKQIKEFEMEGINVPVSMNLSARSICEEKTVENFKRWMKQYQINADMVNVEITETSLISDIEKSRQNIENLKSLGIQVSIDDFGTGYSSMEYLVRYPSNFLKIDRAFIKDLSGSENHQIIVKNMIGLGHGLNIGIVAEGVETEEEWEILKMFGCDIVQGYFFAKPMSVKDFKEFVLKNGISSLKSNIR